MESIRKNIVFNVLLNISNLIFPIFTIPYVSRVLGVQKIGEFNFVITITTYFILIAALGIPMYGVRQIAKIKGDVRETNKVFNEIFSINVVTSLICFIVFFATVLLVPQLYEFKSYYFVASFGILFSFLNVDWFFSGLEKFKVIAFRSIVIKALSLVALFSFVKDKDDILVYIGIYISTLVCNQIWNVLTLRKYNIKYSFTVKEYKKHLNSLFILFFSAVAIQIYLLIDTILIGFLAGYKEVGIYSSAIKSVRLVMPLITAVGAVLLPRIASFNREEKVERDLLLNRSFQFVIFVSIPLTFLFVFIAPYFVPVFFGQGYSEVVLPMQILSLLIFISNLSYFFSVQVLAMLSYDKLFMRGVFIAMFVNISLNVVLISYFDIIGAAIASILGECSLAIYSFIMVKNKVNIQINFRCIYTALLSSLSIFLVYYILSLFTLNNYFTIIGYFVLFGISYFCVQYVVFKDDNIELILKKILK